MGSGVSENQPEIVADSEAAPALLVQPTRRPISKGLIATWCVVLLFDLLMLAGLLSVESESSQFFLLSIFYLATLQDHFNLTRFILLNGGVLLISIVYLVRREIEYKKHKESFDVKKA